MSLTDVLTTVSRLYAKFNQIPINISENRRCPKFPKLGHSFFWMFKVIDIFKIPTNKSEKHMQKSKHATMNEVIDMQIEKCLSLGGGFPWCSIGAPRLSSVPFLPILSCHCCFFSSFWGPFLLGLKDFSYVFLSFMFSLFFLMFADFAQVSY